MSFLLPFLFLLATALPALADGAIGMTRLELPDPQRPLALSLWYPATGGRAEEIGGNAVFKGAGAARGAPPAAGRHPFVLLSHGGLRSAPDSGAWLAAALAGAGFIALEVNGPRPQSAETALDEIWRRPQDLRRALDLILSDDRWAGHIDSKRIAALGFALGGTAALALGGAVIDAPGYLRSCSAEGPGGPDCGWFAAQGVGLDRTDPARLAAPGRDPRIAAVVAIDPEYTHALSAPGGPLAVPARIIALGGTKQPDDGSLPPLAAEIAIPAAQSTDAFPVCTASGPALLSEEGGNPALCGASAPARARIHDEIAHAIVTFLGAESTAPR